MQFNIDRETFLNCLFKVQGIVEKKHTIPILSNVYIETVDEKLVISATDLEVGLKSHYTCEVIKPGKITVSAKKLFEIIKEFPNEIISVKLKENNWLEISCKKAVFNLVGLSPDEFPKFPEINNDFFEMESTLLQEMIENTIFSVSNDETKFNLTGIFVKSENKDKHNYINFVSTDGHRLSLVQKHMEQGLNDRFNVGFILPKKGLIELKKIIDNQNKIIKIGINDNLFSLVENTTTFVMRMIDGDFPDYRKVIPEKTNNVAVINVKNFNHALRRISVLSNEKSKGVKINFSKNMINIISSNTELGDAKEEMDIVYIGNDISIGFNAKYILDILNVIKSENLKFYLKDNISPGMITPEDDTNFLSVIMPMRL
jgi:DNA polymerase-3 subunit beta